MSRDQSYGLAVKMKASLSDMEDLYQEVAQDLFIPRRFRKAPFTKIVKERYLQELGREIQFLRSRIDKVEQAGGSRE